MKKQINYFFLIFLFLLCTEAISSNVGELQKSAQSLYINSQYEDANKLISKIINSGEATDNEKKYAVRMKAVLMEKYLGEIDSAIYFYSMFLGLPLNHRERKTITKKQSFLKSLGDEKSKYIEYQKIIYTNSDDKIRTNNLVNFIKKHPDFCLLKDALKQCAVAGLNSGEYKKAYTAFKGLKKNYSPLSEGEINQLNLCKRVYYRSVFFHLSIFIWLILATVLCFEIFSLIKSGGVSFLHFKLLAVLWFLIVSASWIFYFLVVYHGDYNPLRIGDMILISTISTVSIFLNYYLRGKSSHKFYKLFILILTSFSILSSSYFVLYNRVDRITVMDDMSDQIINIFRIRKD